MPFRIIKEPRNLYFVENIETGRRFSKRPMTAENAKKQFRILNKYLYTLEGSGLNKGQAHEIAKEPITDLDIKKYVPNAKILSSAELCNYKNINELLTKKRDIAFIIYESRPNYGHWVLLSKYMDNDTPIIEYFDSYGGAIDEPNKWVNKDIQKELDLKPYLTNLLIKAQKNNDIIYNSKDFQKEKKDIATCGRHCIQRALTIMKDTQQLSDYIKMMNEIKNITGFNYDDIVSSIITI